MSKTERSKSGRSVKCSGFLPPGAGLLSADWGGAMYSLKIVIEKGGEEALRKFNPALFFSILRAAGGNPYILNGCAYVTARQTSSIIRDAGRWAAGHDPDGSIRREYAGSMWRARPQGAEKIDLG